MTGVKGTSARIVAGALPKDAVGVTCVVPVYNGAGTIARTLDSLRAQSMSDWHAVVIDDGSADASAEVAAGYAQRDARFCVAVKANGGVASARNAGLAFARGRYVHQLDADDWASPGAYEALVGAAERSGARAAAGSFDVTNDLGDAGGEVIYEHVLARADIDREALLTGVQLWTGAHLVRRDDARETPYDESLVGYEDIDCWIRLADRGVRWACTSERVAFHRIRAGSLTKRSADMIECGQRVLRSHGADDAAVGAVAFAYATARALDDDPTGDPTGAAAVLLARADGDKRVDAERAEVAARFAVLYHLGMRPELGVASTDRWLPRVRAWWNRLVRDGWADASVPGEAAMRLAHALLDPVQTVCARLLDLAGPCDRVVVFGHGKNGRAVVRAAMGRGLGVEVRDDRFELDPEFAQRELASGAAWERFGRPIPAGAGVIVTPIEDAGMLERVRAVVGGAPVARWRDVLDELLHTPRAPERRSA